jgi:cytochrome c-type biogenesis protein CcmH
VSVMRGRRLGAWSLAGVVLVLLAALAVRAAVRGVDGPPTLDDRVMAIAAQVRCPVCNGESAAQSNTEPSVHIRDQIAQALEAGQSQQQILASLATEYGSWILYRPPSRGPLAAAWYFPAAAVTLMVVLVVWYLRRREVAPQAAPGAPDAAAGDGQPDEPGGGAGAAGGAQADGLAPPGSETAAERDLARRLRRYL